MLIIHFTMYTCVKYHIVCHKYIVFICQLYFYKTGKSRQLQLWSFLLVCVNFLGCPLTVLGEWKEILSNDVVPFDFRDSSYALQCVAKYLHTFSLTDLLNNIPNINSVFPPMCTDYQTRHSGVIIMIES
jgi:hypothetical protein